ncbi:TetR/AcrR family transcriptional regulator [Streptomyces bauhiniae]|uniref:TetR/AcrR family transcriptional regulator n=1 Tax=Streptomyces bauhiniae TaxID=2340725 RepID=UPI0033B92F85
MKTEKKGPSGRPRGFDTGEALERAMLVFWEHGYEGASLGRLTSAMGISATSMYAAFGNKEELFRKALERYTEGPSAYLDEALEEPTALGVVTAILSGVIRTTTASSRPQGCMGVQGALAAGESGRAAQELLIGWRHDGYVRIRERFERAVEEGDLSAGTDAGLLARYVTTLAHGIAVQAASGVCRDELQAMVDAALRGWPPS